MARRESTGNETGWGEGFGIEWVGVAEPFARFNWPAREEDMDRQVSRTSLANAGTPLQPGAPTATACQAGPFAVPVQMCRGRKITPTCLPPRKGGPTQHSAHRGDDQEPRRIRAPSCSTQGPPAMLLEALGPIQPGQIVDAQIFTHLASRRERGSERPTRAEYARSRERRQMRSHETFTSSSNALQPLPMTADCRPSEPAGRLERADLPVAEPVIYSLRPATANTVLREQTQTLKSRAVQAGLSLMRDHINLTNSPQCAVIPKEDVRCVPKSKPAAVGMTLVLPEPKICPFVNPENTPKGFRRRQPRSHLVNEMSRPQTAKTSSMQMHAATPQRPRSPAEMNEVARVQAIAGQLNSLVDSGMRTRPRSPAETSEVAHLRTRPRSAMSASEWGPWKDEEAQATVLLSPNSPSFGPWNGDGRPVSGAAKKARTSIPRPLSSKGWGVRSGMPRNLLISPLNPGAVKSSSNKCSKIKGEDDLSGQPKPQSRSPLMVGGGKLERAGHPTADRAQSDSGIVSSTCALVAMPASDASISHSTHVKAKPIEESPMESAIDEQSPAQVLDETSSQSRSEEQQASRNDAHEGWLCRGTTSQWIRGLALEARDSIADSGEVTEKRLHIQMPHLTPKIDSQTRSSVERSKLPITRKISLQQSLSGAAVISFTDCSSPTAVCHGASLKGSHTTTKTEDENPFDFGSGAEDPGGNMDARVCQQMARMIKSAGSSMGLWNDPTFKDRFQWNTADDLQRERVGSALAGQIKTSNNVDLLDFERLGKSLRRDIQNSKTHKLTRTQMILNSRLVNLNRPGVRGPYRSPLMLHSKASSQKISSHSPADSCQDSLSLSLSQESIPARDEQHLCTQRLSLSGEQAADKDAAFHSQRDESVQGGHTQREEGWFGILQEVTCLHEQKPRPRSRSLEGQRGPCAAQGETR